MENEIKEKDYNNFKNHPVNNILWADVEKVIANNYNPNVVAKKEMELLELSIISDGFTQPIVTWEREGFYEVVDGFHRHLVGKKLGMKKLPIVVIKNDRTGKNNRIASTIRHNRARGKHTIDGMTDIVVELKKRNWSPKKIEKELGMDKDEVLRLCQISGLAEMFSDKDFSFAWEADSITEEEIVKDYEALD